MCILGNLINKLDKIHKEYIKLCELLSYEEIILDNKLYLKLTKQKQQLMPITTKYQEYIELKKNIGEFQKLVENSNDNDIPLLQVEINNLKTKIEVLEKEINELYKNYNAEMENIVVEILSAKDETDLYLDIIKGYIAFCKNNNLECDKYTEKSTTLQISGLNARKYFIEEIGLHINDNTSIQVYVYDNYNGEKFTFDDQDLVITTCHSSGAGGQHINTTDSAIKITHLPTGITAICQNERSQFQNKQQALSNLKIKVENHYKKLKNDFFTKQKKEQLKLMKNRIAKRYDYKENSITKYNKQKIKLSEFLSGEII